MRTLTAAFVIALSLLALPLWAQGPLLMGAADNSDPATPVMEINIRIGTEGGEALERLLMQHGRIQGEMQAYGAIVNIRFQEWGAAISFLQAISREIDALEQPDEGWVPVRIVQADPRHVRAVIGSQAIPSGELLEVRCTLNPPQVLLRGPEEAVERWARAATQLDVPPPLRPGPEDVVRMYLERWLIVPDEQITPDFGGMYQFITSDEPINLSEFSLLISRAVINRQAPQQAAPNVGPPSLEQTLTGYSGWLNPEISAVYEANVDLSRGVAVVPYSLAWFSDQSFPRWAVAPPPHNELINARQGMGAAQSPGYMRQNPLDSGGMPASGLRNQRMADSLHRGYALVVRGQDGRWRLPMSFDAERRTWLTPLSSTLAERVAPDLLPQQMELGP